MIYLSLFISFFKIGLFSFGGGYAAMPLIQEQVVSLNGWLTLREFSDLITISQMTPGPIAINAATFVGTKIAGIGGATAATLGCIMPSCIIVSVLAWLYIKYRKLETVKGILNSLRPAVVAMIASAGLSIIASAFFPEGAGSFRVDIMVIFIAAVILLRAGKTSPIAVMILCGLAEAVYGIASGIV